MIGVGVLTVILVGLVFVGVRPSAPCRLDVDRASVPTLQRSSTLAIVHASWQAVPRRPPILQPDVVAVWCDELARHVRAGSSLSAALSASSSTDAVMRSSLEPIRVALGRGSTVPEAVAAAAADRKRPLRGHEHLRLACAVIMTAASVGGSASAPLERAAAALRLRAVDRQERATQAAQARMSAHVLTVVPLLMLGVLIATDADVRAVVVGPAGAACIAIGLVLNVIGWSWMRRIVGGSE